MTTTETRPGYTVATENDLLAKAVKEIAAWTIQCKYCDTQTGLAPTVTEAVAAAKTAGMMVLDIDSLLGVSRPTVVCAKCAKRSLASFRTVSLES